MTRSYAHPEVLVSTEWVAANLNQPNIKLLEIDVDTRHYDSGHLPGAIGFNWRTELQDQLTRDIPDKGQFERLAGSAGISQRDTVIIYGDSNNWFAAYGFWLFKLYGHADLRLMDGGRQKWLNEERPLVTDIAHFRPAQYKAKDADQSLRARLMEVMEVSRTGSQNLVDVRSNAEYNGEADAAAPGMMMGITLRHGHIPGATGIPWGTAVNVTDGTFRSAEELHKIYIEEQGLDPDRGTVVYCRIGERSSHTWFVLKYLIGLENVKNYDGSWAEYGNLIGAPIEKVEAALH